MRISFCVWLWLGPISYAFGQQPHPVDESVSSGLEAAPTPVPLSALTKSLSEIGTNFSVVHNTRAVGLARIENTVKQTGKLPSDWPWWGRYPALWTSWSPDGSQIKTIDGDLNASFTYGTGEAGVRIRLDLNPKSKVLVMTQSRLTDSQTAELARLFKKRVAPSEVWSKYMHGLTDTIRKAAEAGYDAIVTIDSNGALKELVILNTPTIQGLFQYMPDGKWRQVFPKK